MKHPHRPTSGHDAWSASLRAVIALAIVLVAILAGGRLARSDEPARPDPSAPAAPPGTAFPGADGHTHFVVGISPFLEPAARNDAFRHLVRFSVEDMPLNSTLSLYDAYHLRTITRMVVPAVRAFESPKTRLNQFAESIQIARRFLARTNARPSTPGLTFEGAMRLPQFLDFVTDNLVAADQRLVVILLGSPLYQDEKEPGFSMAGGFFPSDGHLLATRDKSVYGLKDRGQRLEGVAVHLGHFGDPWATELHHEKIARFWRLFVEGQGGRMAGLSGDLPTVFQIVQRDLAAARRGTRGESGTSLPVLPVKLDPTQTKVEMLRISRDVGSAEWITGDQVTRPAQGPPVGTVGPLKIGIRWQGQSDLDLYARARPTADRLYFEHARSPDGYYFKDHRSSPDREFEFIEFTEPVDVRQVEAQVNFYEGTAPTGGLGGEVRAEFEGRIYSTRFQLDARDGNRGREGVGQSSFWYRVDLPALLKLR